MSGVVGASRFAHDQWLRAATSCTRCSVWSVFLRGQPLRTSPGASPRATPRRSGGHSVAGGGAGSSLSQGRLRSGPRLDDVVSREKTRGGGRATSEFGLHGRVPAALGLPVRVRGLLDHGVTGGLPGAQTAVQVDDVLEAQLPEGLEGGRAAPTRGAVDQVGLLPIQPG